MTRPVRGLRKTDGHDERLARQADGVGGADNHKGLGGRGVKERGQTRLFGAHTLQGVADPPGVAVGQGDDGERALGRLHRVLNDGVDDGAHLGGR